MSDRLKRCNNNCIFCFIDQLPKGLRNTLYIKDDDYLSSFQYGNFITLTNIGDDELRKIVVYDLQPLNISVHSLNKEVRSKLFRNKNHALSLKNLKFLDKNNISTNIQIVLCPGLNEGKDLKNTITGLLKDFKNILSIGIVPVGITRFNEEKELLPVDRKIAENTIYDVSRIKNKHDPLNKVFLSDEFYILAGKRFPGIEHYGELCQINNGVGKAADLLSCIRDKSFEIKKSIIERKSRVLSKDMDKVLIVTSEYGYHVLPKVLASITDILSEYLPLPGFEIEPVKNEFLGGNVKVTGLLSGKDIISRLKYLDTDRYEKIMVPDCIFNKSGLTIDDIKIDGLQAFSEKIIIIREDFSDFFENIFSLKEYDS